MNREEIEEQTKQLNEELEIKLSEWEKQFSDTDKDFARVCFKKGVDWMYERNRAEIDKQCKLIDKMSSLLMHVLAMRYNSEQLQKAIDKVWEFYQESKNNIHVMKED